MNTSSNGQTAKTLVDCGNCGPDFASIRQMVTRHFKVHVIQTHGTEDTLEVLKNRKVDLVTVNRKLDRDYTDGLDVIRQIKSDPDTHAVPVMLVSNYEEHQQTATETGAVPGFGKLALTDPATRSLLEPFLGDA
ncbi:response regulator [Crateriforma conspicua]|nr:response regulator [Crateriforma conspicua]